MKLEDAIKGALETRKALRSKQGIYDPNFISENMQRLAHYTGSIEEHLAELEEQLEVAQLESFNRLISEGNSANAADKLCRAEVKDMKGAADKLKRYCSSSWSLISTSQSRFNHIEKQMQQEG